MTQAKIFILLLSSLERGARDECFPHEIDWNRLEGITISSSKGTLTMMIELSRPDGTWCLLNVKSC